MSPLQGGKTTQRPELLGTDGGRPVSTLRWKRLAPTTIIRVGLMLEVPMMGLSMASRVSNLSQRLGVHERRLVVSRGSACPVRVAASPGVENGSAQ